MSSPATSQPPHSPSKPPPQHAAETARFYLQDLSVEEHLHDLHELIHNPDAMRWSSKAPSTSLEQTLAYMLPAIRPPRAELEGVEDRSWVLNYAILLKDPDASSSRQKLKMIGRLGVVRKGPREHVHWERYGGGGEELALGYGVSPDWWGRGVMAEAMGGFLELYWGLEENKHVHELVAQVDVENLASQRVMQKAGAEMRVPVVKDGYMLHGNRKRDMQVWGLKRPGSTVEGGGGD